MPFIDCKISCAVSDSDKEKIKSELGKSITLMHKSEGYLMLGITDKYDLYFGGKKLEKGAYVGVNLFGKPSSGDCEAMTKAVCNALSDILSIDPSNVYVSYMGFSEWGWNGSNF